MRRNRKLSALLALAVAFGGASVACEASGDVDDEGGEIDVDVGDDEGEDGEGEDENGG